jgi:hypothetical protein
MIFGEINPWYHQIYGLFSPNIHNTTPIISGWVTSLEWCSRVQRIRPHSWPYDTNIFHVSEIKNNSARSQHILQEISLNRLNPIKSPGFIFVSHAIPWCDGWCQTSHRPLLFSPPTELRHWPNTEIRTSTTTSTVGGLGAFCSLGMRDWDAPWPWIKKGGDWLVC